MIKNAAKAVVVRISWAFARLYVRRFRPVIVGVAGSVGKTGTKRAIAHVASSGKRVAWQDGNYNDIVTVPLIFFGLEEPSLFNPFAWLGAFVKMIVKLCAKTGVEVVVLELGTDTPGMIPAFGKYLTLDHAVVTGVEAEHMESFGSLEAVAREELAVAIYAKQVYLDQSIVAGGFAKDIKDFLTYGPSLQSDIHFTKDKDELVIGTGKSEYRSTPSLVGEHQYYALAVAAAIADRLGVGKAEIEQALSSLQPMPGRMQKLAGKDGSILIDDTYNASPKAIQAALDYLYSQPSKHRIAVLGNMNEMGDSAEQLHKEVGSYCDAQKLDLVVTIGKEANSYLAVAAKQKGCQVMTFDSPYEIGSMLANKDLKDTVILFKGSQNGVFLEEAVKSLLAKPSEVTRLVRQSAQWMSKKKQQFGEVS